MNKQDQKELRNDSEYEDLEQGVQANLQAQESQQVQDKSRDQQYEKEQESSQKFQKEYKKKDDYRQLQKKRNKKQTKDKIKQTKKNKKNQQIKDGEQLLNKQEKQEEDQNKDGGQSFKLKQNQIKEQKNQKQKQKQMREEAKLKKKQIKQEAKQKKKQKKEQTKQKKNKIFEQKQDKGPQQNVELYFGSQFQESHKQKQKQKQKDRNQKKKNIQQKNQQEKQDEYKQYNNLINPYSLERSEQNTQIKFKQTPIEQPKQSLTLSKKQPPIQKDLNKNSKTVNKKQQTHQNPKRQNYKSQFENPKQWSKRIDLEKQENAKKLKITQIQTQIKNQFKHFLQKLPKELKKSQYPKIAKWFQEGQPNNKIVQILGLQKIFFLKLYFSKIKNLSKLIQKVFQFTGLVKHFPATNSEQQIRKKSRDQINKNYLKFEERKQYWTSYEFYNNNDLVLLSKTIIASQKIEWLSQIILQPLQLKLNGYLQKHSRQDDNFLQLLRLIQNQLIFNKTKLVETYFTYKISSWRYQKQDFRKILLEIVYAHKQGVIDTIYKKEYFNKIWKQFGSSPAQFLETINPVFENQYFYKIGQKLLQLSKTLVTQFLNSYFKDHKKGLKYLIEEAYKDLSNRTYGEFIQNWIQERIVQEYSKMSQKNQTNYFKTIEMAKLVKLASKLMQYGTPQQLYQKLRGFYVGQFHNYKMIDLSCERYKIAFDFMRRKLLELQITYEEMLQFYSHSKQIQNNTKKLKIQAKTITNQLQNLIESYKNLLGKISDVSKVVNTINDPRATKLSIYLKGKIQQLQSAESLKKTKIPVQIEKLAKKQDILSKIIGIPAFDLILSEANQETTQVSWILSCVQKFQHQFHKNIQGISSKKFNLKQFLDYFQKINVKTLSNLLKICKKQEQQQKLLTYKNYLDQQKLKINLNFFLGLSFFISKMNIQLDDLQLNNDCVFIEKILSIIRQESNQGDTLNLTDLDEGMKNIVKKLRFLKLNYFKLKQNLAVEVISKAHQHKPIIQLAFQCTKKQLDSLVDFIAQDDEQMISVVTQFSTIFRLTEKIKQSSKNLQIIEIVETFTEQLRKQKQVLWLNIANCDAVCNTIKMKIEQSGDRSFSFKHQVEAIIKNSTIQVASTDHWDSWEIYIKFNLDGKIVRKGLNRLREFRDKTTLFIGQADQKNIKQNLLESQVQKIELFKKFHEVFKAFQTIWQATDFLLQEGFPAQGLVKLEDIQQQQQKTFNFQYHRIYQHSQNTLQRLIQRANQMKKSQQKWAQNMKKLWNQSYLASHLDGKKMKKLINNIVVQRKFDNTLETILGINSDTIMEMQKDYIIQCINQPSVQSIYIGYSEFFKSFQPYEREKVKQYGADSPFLVYHEEELKFYWIIFCLSPNASVCDILFCSTVTKQNQVERFLIRAQKSRSYSFIINSHKLDQKAEYLLFTRLTQMKQNRKLYKSNLVFIQTRRDHRVFQTLTSRRFNYKIQKFQNLKVDKKFIQNAINPCQIVWSLQASSGKTHWIKRQIIKQHRNPKYLSLCGEINQKDVSDEIRNLNLNREKDALIIEISYTHNPSYMNQVLARILLFRCLQIGVSRIDKQVPIFVEIANLYNFKHFQKLPILKLISQLNNIVKEIPKFNLAEIDLQQPTQQVLYVSQMLRLIATREINIVQFKEIYKLPQNFKDLMKIYLFQPLQSKKQQVSGFLYTNFIRKLYDNFKAFNQGFFMIGILQQIGLNGPTIRSDILQIIIKNTRDFLKEYFNTSMYTGQNSSRQDFRDKLRDLGLLIVPVIGGGFSFIFSDSKSVPNILKQYMIIQEENVDFDKTFCLSQMEQQARVNQIKKRLKRVTGVPEIQNVQISPTYKLTQDNFRKMCIILYRIQSGIPVVLMGESGVGKTSLITQLSKIIKTQLVVFQVHAGKRKKQIHNFVQNIITQYKINLTVSSYFSQIELKNYQKQSLQLQDAVKYLNGILQIFSIQPRLNIQALCLVLQKMQVENQQNIKITDLKIIFKKLLSNQQVNKIIGAFCPGKKTAYENKIKLLVLIDEYNTTEQVCIFKQLIMDRRYKNEELPDGIVFIACCNPYVVNPHLNNINQTDGAVGLNFKRAELRQENKLAFKVQPPPQSLRLVTQDYQQLDPKQIKSYAQIILKEVTNAQKIAQIITNIHIKLHKRYGKSCASLRDIERFRRLYHWFKKNCPQKSISVKQIQNSICKYYFSRAVPTNIGLDFEERVVIVTLCACYVSKAQSQSNKEQIIKCIGEAMNKTYENIVSIYDAEQVEFLKRMVSNQKIVMNKALKQNVFLMLVCIMNKIANLTIGVPGCSKSLSISLIQSNLRGPDSKSEFYRNFPEVRIIPFQASQACTSQAIESVFDKAEQICIKMKKYENIIFVVMIDEIGLAEYSPDNPLKVLHSRLQLTQKRYSVVGISNWTLDNAKASRFLICSRTLPNLQQLNQTAVQLLKAYVPRATADQVLLFTQLSRVYYHFMRQWRNNRVLNKNFPQFFGLRDKYSFQKNIYSKLLNNSKASIAQAINSSIKMNFDGQEKSVQTFINMLANVNENQVFDELRESARIGPQINPIQQCQMILNTKGSRCIMLIIPSDVLLPAMSKYFKNSICLHGSNFLQDKLNEDYNLSKIAQITSYVAKPHLIIMKDMNETIYTALYDLFNKNYTQSGDKKFCRVASGANMKPRVQVSEQFNAILFVHENDILNGKVDSAFLNRFCKIYFKLNRFLQEGEYDLVRRVISWLQTILKSIVNKNSCLNMANFFLNCSENALFSLAISLREQNNEDKQEIMKQIIMRNKTFEVELAVKHQIFRLPNIKIYQEKSKNKIIYTYDLDCQFQEDTLLQEQGPSETIFISKIRQQKSLNKTFQQFLNKKEKVMKIKLNYQTHGYLFNQILFKIDQIIKTGRQAEDKIFIVIVFLKRYKITTQNPCISYLYPFQQSFISQLPRKDKKQNSILPNILKSKNYLEFYQSCHKKQLEQIPEQFIFSAFSRVRPVFKVPDNYKQKVQQYWNQVKKSYNNNKLFKQFLLKNTKNYCIEKKINKQFVQKYFKDNQIYSRSSNVVDALRRFANKFIEDAITAIIIYIIKKGILFQFDRRIIIKVLQIEDNELITKIEKSEKKLDQILTILTQNRDKHQLLNMVIRRQFQSNQAQIRLPYLFPYSSVQTQLYFSITQNQQAQKPNNNNLQSKIYDLLLKSRFQSENQQQNKAQILALLKHSQSQFFQRSIFVRYQYDELTQKSQLKWNYLEQFARSGEVVQLFLYDIVTALYKDKLGGYQNLTQIYNLAISSLKVFSLTDTFIALSGDIEVIKLFSQLIKALKEAGYDYSYNIGFQNQNPVLLPKQYIEQLMQQFFQEQILMGSDQTIKSFESVQHYIQVIPVIDKYLKKLQKQKYLKIKIPKQFTLLCRWLTKMEKVIQQGKLKHHIVKWIELNKKYGVYLSIMEISYSIVKNKIDINIQNQAKQLPDLCSFIGSKLFYFWYKRQISEAIQDEDYEKGDEALSTFCEWLFKWCDVSNVVAQSINLTLNEVFNIGEDVQGIKYLRQIDQHEQDQQKRIDDRVIQNLNKCLSKQNSNLNIALNNFAYYNYANFEEIEQQDSQGEWHKAFSKIKDKTDLDDLTSIFNFSFCKVLLKQYIDDIFEEKANQFTAIVNRNLIEKGTISDSLGVYGLKCLRKKCISLNQMKIWIQKRIAPWMLNYLNFFEQQPQLPDPPAVTLSAPYKQLMKILITTKFNAGQLKKLFDFNQTHEELYWTISTFMKNLYFGKLSQAHNRVKQMIEHTNLSMMVKHVIKCYCDKKISQQYNVPNDIEGIQIQKLYYKQIPFLNILNWFVAISQTQNPLVNSFTSNGEFPNKFAQFLSNRHLICGIQSPYRRNIDNIVKFNNKDVGVYKCSRECDYIYTHLGCGYPAQYFNCKVCKLPSGGMHNLAGIQRGANRLGPCLYVDAAGKFTPERHQIETPLYTTGSLLVHQSYWKSFPIYLSEYGLQISNKQSTRTQQGILILTGYRSKLEKHELDDIQRMSSHTRQMLRIISCIVMYFASKLSWIKQNQIVAAFQLAKIRFQQSQLEQTQSLYKGLAQRIQQISPWFLGVTRQIFNSALNYNDQCTKFHTKKINQIDQVIAIAQNQYPRKQGYQARVIREVIIPDLQRFKNNIKYTWQTTTIYSRENFEQIVDSKILQLLSNQKQLQFIQKIQKDNQKDNDKANKINGDDLLLQMEQPKFFEDDYRFIHHISLVRQLPHQKFEFNQQDTQLWLQNYLPEMAGYTLLEQIIKRPDISAKLQNYKIILCFLNNLMNICDRKINRQFSKTQKICDFFSKLPVNLQQKMKKDFQKFKTSWVFFVNQNGRQIQYNCKVLGKFSMLNENNQLKYFLPDTRQDVKNSMGLAIHYALMLIAHDYNQQINYLYKFSSKNPSKIKLDPGRVTEDAIVSINLKYIQQQIQTYTNYSCAYGKTVGKVSYGSVLQNTEDKFLNNGYYLEQDLLNIRQIAFQGQNMLSQKHTACLEQLKKSSSQSPLDEKDQQQLLKLFDTQKQHNQDGFYNKSRDCLDSLQIIMIYYRTFLQQTPKNTKIGNFIVQRAIHRQVPSIFEDKKYSQTNISNLIALYQIIEDSIGYKAETIIPQQYKEQPDAEKWKVCKKYIDSLNDTNQVITLELLFKASQRLILRRMLSFNPNMTQQTIGFSLTRLDFWPITFTQESFYGMVPNIDIKITQFYTYYMYLKQKFEKKTKKVLKPFQQQQLVEPVEVVKKQQIQQNTKKKVTKVKQTLKKAQVDA